MKHTLLATTALVAMTGAAAAEITISGTARIGVVTTEGAAAVTGSTTYKNITANMVDSVKGAAAWNAVGVTITADTTPTKTEFDAADLLLANGILAVELKQRTIANIDTVTEREALAKELSELQLVRAAIQPTVVKTAAKKADTTVGKNRVRIAFAGSGTTDGGLTYGFSARADHSNTSTGGSQYISGAFGKVSMGDLNGGDEQLVGNLSGVGSSGAGSHQEFAYQSSSHNIGYSVSMAGVSFAATTDLVRGADATKTGSNSAYGVKYSGDMGGATIGLALGTSKIGNKTEDSMSASVSMGGLSIMAVSHTNDNGPATSAGTVQTGTAAYVAEAAAANLDTDTTGLSISYAMDAMSVTAYTRTESTSGVVDKDYSGVGFTYNLGGATIKAGFVDANDISIMDFGINFSF
jgi:outer membrane protein OmpU